MAAERGHLLFVCILIRRWYGNETPRCDAELIAFFCHVEALSIALQLAMITLGYIKHFV
jgi:hypothetical protein